MRGRGLFWAVEVNPESNVTGHDLAYILMKKGLLTKATHDYALRLAPALIIQEGEVVEAANIIKEGVVELEKINDEKTRAKKTAPAAEATL